MSCNLAGLSVNARKVSLEVTVNRLLVSETCPSAGSAVCWSCCDLVLHIVMQHGSAICVGMVVTFNHNTTETCDVWHVMS